MKNNPLPFGSHFLKTGEVDSFLTYFSDCYDKILCQNQGLKAQSVVMGKSWQQM